MPTQISANKTIIEFQSLEAKMKVDPENCDAVVRRLVVATQQELGEENDMRTRETLCGLQSLVVAMALAVVVAIAAAVAVVVVVATAVAAAEEWLRVDREAGYAAVRALVVASQQGLGIQSLEGRLKVEHEVDDEAVHALVVATQQELAEENDMRLTEAIEHRQGLQTVEGCLTQHLHDDAGSNVIMMHDHLAENLNQMKAAFNAQETLRLQASHEMNDKVEKLSNELEAVQRKCATAHDEITAFMIVVKNSIEKEKVWQEKTDDHIKTQIDNVKQELTEERGERDNEFSMLKEVVKNLEEQLSTHVKELMFAHEAEVNKRSMAHETPEQTHCELKDGLDAYDTNHLEAFTGPKDMIEQEIKPRGKDTSKRERTFSEASTATSESMDDLSDDLSDRLKRLSDELGREVQDRTVGDAAVRALVVATQQELAEEKGMRLAEATELRRGLQTLEGCLTQHLQDLKLSVDDERSNLIMMHDCLAESLDHMKAAAIAQESLRFQASHEMNDKAKKLSGKIEAVQVEQTHHELKGGLDGQNADHPEALTALNMREQEIKGRERDTSNTERTFSAVSARFDTESSTRESKDDLSDRLKRFCDELGRELQDSFRRIAHVFFHKDLGCVNS